MSWSVSASGTKEETKANAAAQFDNAAKMYPGTEEEKDILAAKERTMSLLDALDLTVGRTEGDAPLLARVYAYGSHSTWSDGAVSKCTSAQLNVTVDRFEPSKV